MEMINDHDWEEDLIQRIAVYVDGEYLDVREALEVAATLYADGRLDEVTAGFVERLGENEAGMADAADELRPKSPLFRRAPCRHRREERVRDLVDLIVR